MRTNTVGGRMFDIINYILLSVFAIVTVIPFIYVIAGSFATSTELASRAFFLIPKTFSLNAYQYIFSTDTLFKSGLVSVYVTVVGTVVNLLFTTTMAYALSRRHLIGRNTVLNLVVFSMVFGGGMIPTFLVVKGLGMLDSLWAMIIPGAINAFNLIIIKNFFQELPPSLLESASIDGCTDLGIFWRIVLPLSKPVLATFALFYAVGHWNDFFSALLYINDSAKWPLQVILQQFVMMSQGTIGDASSMDPTFVKPPDQSVKMAVIVVSSIPIMLVYPWLQKYFVKGVMVGAVKG
ncbi:MAG: lplC2 [Bacilli bacterium]|nr:lplC2 [Bacilli bacterium]